MSHNNLIIKLDNNTIQLNNDTVISYESTNLPKQEFTFKTHKPICWELEQQHYDTETQTLTVRVINYKFPPDNILSESKPMGTIKNLCFEKFNWDDFEPLTTGYSPHKIKNSFNDHPLSLHERKRTDENNLIQSAPNLFYSSTNTIKVPKEIEVKVKFKNAVFEHVKVSFYYTTKECILIQPIEVHNQHIREEFEHIKPFIIKRLGHTFLVKIKFNSNNNFAEDVTTFSEEIDKINESLISLIRTDAILDIKNFKSTRVEKTLYDYTELSINDNILSMFNISPENIIESFINTSNLKNKKQLEFLSTNKQSYYDKIQFTIQPYFGFVFHHYNNQEYFIWELLNSHATYVWKSKGNPQVELQSIVEQAISTIKQEGRVAYKKYYKSLSNPDYSFTIITHASLKLTEEERFIEWLQKLKSF